MIQNVCIPAMPRNLNKSIDSRKIQSCVVECICYGCRSSCHNLLDDRLREHFHNKLFLFLFLFFHVIWFSFNANSKNLYSAQCVKMVLKCLDHNAIVQCTKVPLLCIAMYLYRFYGVFGQYTKQRAYDQNKTQSWYSPHLGYEGFVHSFSCQIHNLNG